MTMPSELTGEEKAAISSLRRLALRWPQSLMLFSQSGSLYVARVPSAKDELTQASFVALVSGIPNDGGDADA